MGLSNWREMQLLEMQLQVMLLLVMLLQLEVAEPYGGLLESLQSLVSVAEVGITRTRSHHPKREVKLTCILDSSMKRPHTEIERPISNFSHMIIILNYKPNSEV